MEYEEAKEYWNKRAMSKKETKQTTTNDIYLRKLETQKVLDLISSYDSIKTVADFGCGDGLTTIELAKQFPEIQFVGYDYASNMIQLAKEASSDLDNVRFEVLDIFKDDFSDKFDVIFTDRVLINLPKWDSMKVAIEKITKALTKTGRYIMVENFLDGQDSFNKLRKQFSLDEIPIRDHNIYLDKKEVYDYLDELKLDLDVDENISSLYYIISRIVYTKICKKENKEPNYSDIHHVIGSQLPSLGNYGPISLLVFKKR